MSIEAMQQALAALETCRIRSVSEWEVSDVTPKNVTAAISALRTAIQQAESAEAQTKTGVPDDSKRLDYLQERGATIDLIPGVADFYPMQFRVGGLHSSANTDVRAAIDAAMLAAAPGEEREAVTSDPEYPIQPGPYKVCLGMQPAQIAHSYAEVWKLIGNATFGTTHMVYDAKGQIVDEFVPY